MPTLSTSNGKEKITLSLSEVRQIFQALYIVRGIEKYLGTPEKTETNERKFQDLARALCKEYGAGHLDAAGYPKETVLMKKKNEL